MQTNNSVTGSPFIGQLTFARGTDVTSGKISGYAEIDLNNDGAEFTAIHITPTGNVAIGTTDPKTYKLAVDGSAIATSMTVKLYADWPDYVFKPKYHLPSLATVKAYIDKNQHLPDMPSEQEVKDNGINLGEIVKVQTKKIEELTLYLIEKDKQLNDQSKKLSEQQKATQSQQEQINQLKEQLASLTKVLTKN